MRQHPTSNRGTLLLALLVMLLALMAGGRAAADETHTVIVPYDPAKPPAEQSPDSLYLPYERFLDLWQRTKANRRPDADAPKAPANWAISSARYDGTVNDRALAFRGTLEVLTANDAWVKIPLEFLGAKISALNVDGKPAAYDGGAVVIERPGRHRIEVTFEIPRDGLKTELGWKIPRAAGTLVSLTLPEARMSATISPGSGTIERVNGETRVVSAALGDADEVQVSLTSAAPAERKTEPASATVASEVTITPAAQTTRATVTFAFPAAQQDRFTVFLDPKETLLAIDAENLKSWHLAPEGGRQSLEISLHEPAHDSFALTVTTDRAMPPLPADGAAPAVGAAAARVETSTALFADDRILLMAKPDAAARQISWDTRGAEDWRNFVAAFAGGAPLGFHAEFAPSPHEARVDAVYQVDRRKAELIASWKLLAKGRPLFSSTFGLPAGFEVQAVESPRLQDWWRAGDSLHVRFSGPTPELTELVVYLVRQYPAAPTDIAVQPMTIGGFKQVTGEAVIAAHKGVDVSLTLSDAATEVSPDKAATVFEILPPLERKRGFTFSTQTYAGKLALKALPAKWNALWVMHAEAHEGWISLATRARLALRQGSIDHAIFSIPAGFPELRVSGDEVRETRSRVEGGQRLYDVQFQNDVYGQVEFSIAGELPNPGETELPALTFLEAGLTGGFVLTDNASEYELRLKSSGVDPAPESEIPWLPALSKSANIFRVRPGWSIVMATDRLEKVSGRAAFCAWAEFTTALRRDGTAWHKGTWRLQNRSLQFLPVRLPAGAELMSAKVAGQSVRADAGSVDGAGAILIPLIKTKPGDLSYDVELVWRTRGEELGSKATRTFDDPELPGITVERTLWNVWLPDDRELPDFETNMEPVVEEMQTAGKLEGAAQELRSLVSLASSSKGDAQSRRSAYENAERLWQQIDEQSKTADESDERKTVAADAGEKVMKGGAREKQQRFAGEKNRQLVEEARQQVTQLRDAAEQFEEWNEPALENKKSGAGADVYLGKDAQRETKGGKADEWTQNRQYEDKGEVQSTPPPPPNAPADATDFLINDSVVLKRPAESLEMQNEPVSRSRESDIKVPAAQTATPATPGAAPYFRGRGIEETGQGFQFNTARGNALAGALPQGVPAGAQPADAPAMPALATARKSDEAKKEAAATSVEPPVQQRLQTDGRISLAVDFPTEGRVHHFQKVKAHAGLEVTVTAKDRGRRLKWLGLAILASAGLAGSGRVLEGRQKSRRSGLETKAAR